MNPMQANPHLPSDAHHASREQLFYPVYTMLLVDLHMVILLPFVAADAGVAATLRNWSLDCAASIARDDGYVHLP
jgi:hypothetical protein